MDNYNVGSNKPIKLKVAIASPATAFTYIGLNNPENPSKFIEDLSFVTKPNSGWKQINNGEGLQNRNALIRTLLDFFDATDDEDEFNLLVQQSKEAYTIQISGGTPTKMSLQLIVKSNFTHRSATFTSQITFN